MPTKPSTFLTPLQNELLVAQAEIERLRAALERIAMYLADGDAVFAIQEIARKTLNEQ